MRLLKWASIILGGLLGVVVVVAILAIGIGVFLFDRKQAATVPAGYKRVTAQYVTSADGTRLAVELWLPADLASGKRIPALIKATPYWRAGELTLIGKGLATWLAPDIGTEPDVPVLNQRGYAVATVDVRGTGASFGTIKIMFSDAEVNDYDAVATWITKQPWSNGKVGAYGFSYRGISAASMASLSNPAIKAVAPLFDLTDLYLLGNPGGAYASYLLHAWGAQTRELNLGRPPCAGDTVCEIALKGPKRVDSDTNGALLAAALAEHEKSYNVDACARAAPARDDKICDSGSSLGSVSPLARKAKIEARNLPMFVLTGWLDESSPAQVLHRFNTFANPQEVVLGPFTHGGFQGDDPFAPNGPMAMTFRQQTEAMADFFDRYLRDKPGAPISKSVRYYVIGESRWKTSPSWPPAGSAPVHWYPQASRGLVDTAPDAGSDAYKVDFNATTGSLSGYRGQVDLSQTNYGDRAAADAHLLAYTSAPLATDMEIAGNPIAHVRLASTASDGLLIVYLEDVSPQGRVTYVSQGVLHLVHRKPATPEAAAGSADPLHSYLRADMTAMVPGVAEDVTVAISPIAALIRKGHRLRVTIAGADAVNLERVPAKGDATLTIERGAGTYVELPVMGR
jgi:putative CocE/NonD family hydrolase